MSDLIYGNASTFSKMHCNYPDIYVEEVSCGTGHDIITLEGTPKLDTISSLGAQLFKHNDNAIMSLPYLMEKILAQEIINKFPFVEMVRYGLNGADATEGAIRYARAFTKKHYVLSCGYHSCQSSFTYYTPPALGCINGDIHQVSSLVEMIEKLEESKQKQWSGYGAVIIEPIMLNINTKPQLLRIRELTKELGIVLIFDEIITGMRVPKYCVANWFEVYPDIILLGKALGRGHPISVIGGKKEIMDVPVFHSYTFAGYPKGIDSAIETLQLTELEIEHFWYNCSVFMDKINTFMAGKIVLEGYPTRGIWKSNVSQEHLYVFWQEMYKRGILLGPCFFPRMTWKKEDFDRISMYAEVVVKVIDKFNIKLESRMPRPVFKRN